MIFPESFESKIGFDRIRALVADNCSGRMSAEEAEKMAFSSDYDVVARNLHETAEMLAILNNSLDPGPGGVGRAGGGGSGGEGGGGCGGVGQRYYSVRVFMFLL